MAGHPEPYPSVADKSRLHTQSCACLGLCGVLSSVARASYETRRSLTALEALRQLKISPQKIKGHGISG
jgi:hypothetical protein